MNEIYEFFLEAYSNSPTFIIILEFIAFVFGIISDFKVGIDVQEFNNRINTVAKKFIGYETLYVKDNDTQILSIIWNIKESIYKIAKIIGLDYKNHLLVIPFNINDDFTYSWLIYKKRKERYISYFFTII